MNTYNDFHGLSVTLDAFNAIRDGITHAKANTFACFSFNYMTGQAGKGSHSYEILSKNPTILAIMIQAILTNTGEGLGEPWSHMALITPTGEVVWEATK